MPMLDVVEKLLIVDNNGTAGTAICDVLVDAGYGCTTVSNALEARQQLAEHAFALIICDVASSNGDAMNLVADVLSGHTSLAAIIVTELDAEGAIESARAHGAYGCITRPFAPGQVLFVVSNALYRRQLELEIQSMRAQNDALDFTGSDRVLSAEQETIQRLCRAAEFRDNETAQHIQRMSEYSALVAKLAGMSRYEVEVMRAASPMHDVGKIGVPDSILFKPGKLTDKEFELMKLHTQIGYRILSGSESELLQMGARIALSHHEKFDGSGYPNGLATDAILVEGRIVAIVDVFDALTTKRCYKEAFSVEKSVSIMSEGRAKH
ncbi:MAG TPA: HD domain-containing protein, partial [Myxococcales bacterium]|nr:HD domain-containing protein [Myxococcales bacterium]